jgi:hypothetical protein
MATNYMMWSEGTERDHPKTFCVECRGKIRVGHFYYIISIDPFQALHIPCKERLEVMGQEKSTEAESSVNNLTLTKGEKIMDAKKKVAEKKVVETRVPDPKRAEMIYCATTGGKIPRGGCETRQVKPKNKCKADCEHFKGQKKSKKVSKPKKISKLQKIRDLFSEKKTHTAKELMKESGFDKTNLRTAMSILKNPKRTKELLRTDYDRKTEAYTLVK